MQIPVEKILEKMSKEIAIATQYKHDAAKIREHMSVIQSLCELVMDGSATQYETARPVVQPMVQATSIQPMSNGMRVEGNRVIESESDSLLDF